ncbi:hypothetical protein [Clostridium frigidicarnis]|uniref:Uncharacterized protein n=1 Tax=Clostridium frigidicarnis TaxID=84698 RepID=A0A1I0ZAV8_9CLOT|nr:hypothetical protein [Clostridium frigidicarnis]SFB21373.1 hypothetical protein SAMN04488528_101810 [Clostridium frigidicarnis]
MKDKEKNSFLKDLMKNQAFINSGAISAYRTDIVKDEIDSLTNEKNNNNFTGIENKPEEY